MTNICERFNVSPELVFQNVDVKHVFNSDVLLKSLQEAATSNKRYNTNYCETISSAFLCYISNVFCLICF